MRKLPGSIRPFALSYPGSFHVSLLTLLAVFLCEPWLAVAEAKDPYIGDRIGIDIHDGTVFGTVGKNRALLDRISDAGIGWVRLDFDWWRFEPAKGSFDWTVHDEVVTQARARGLNIFASIGYTPAWATDAEVRTGVPRNVNDWTSAVSAAVRRYKDDIQHWGIWNEPNTTAFWKGNRQEFIDVIVKPGADAIRAWNPNAKVLGPELAHFFSTGRTWYLWMEDILSQAGGKIDIITHHTYPRPLSASHASITSLLNKTTVFGDNPDRWGFLGVYPSVREVFRELNWNGDIWLTEFGWRLTDSSEQQIADNYTGLFNDWLTGHPDRDWIDKLLLYHGATDEYGLFNPDGSPRQAYYAIEDFIESQMPESSSSGDADLDGDVDDDDLSLLLANWTGVGGEGKNWGQGDFDGNEAVTDSDLSLLLANWTGPDSLGMPEPATAGFLALGSVLLLSLRHRDRR